MEWVEEFSEARIDDVHWLDLIVPVEDVKAAVVRMLPEIKAQAARVPLSAQEESDLVPAMTLFNTPSIIQKHKADIDIYMEACLAYSKLKIGKFLVTDNHHFFSNFLQSAIAEVSAQCLCKDTQFSRG